jgi:hypothetical protein
VEAVGSRLPTSLLLGCSFSTKRVPNFNSQRKTIALIHSFIYLGCVQVGCGYAFINSNNKKALRKWNVVSGRGLHIQIKVFERLAR